MTKINKILIIVLIILIVVSVFVFLPIFYPKKTIKNAEQPPLRVNRPLPLSPLESEVAMVKGKTDDEIKADFAKEKSDCLNRFEITKPEELIKFDKYQASTMAICEAIRNADLKKCDWLNSNEDTAKKCRETVSLHLNILYPMFQKKSCDANNFPEKNDQYMCEGFVLRNVESCNKFKSDSPVARTVCLAAAQNDLSLCDKAPKDRGQNMCEYGYYYILALRENSQSYLNKIKDEAIIFTTGSLFFDKNGSCLDILKPSNEKYCLDTFLDELLVRRLEIAKVLRFSSTASSTTNSFASSTSESSIK